MVMTPEKPASLGPVGADLDVHVTNPVPVYGFLGAWASSPLLKQVRHLHSQELVVHLHNRHLEVLVIVLQD
jgi:hypothetical protein